MGNEWRTTVLDECPYLTPGTFEAWVEWESEVRTWKCDVGIFYPRAIDAETVRKLWEDREKLRGVIERFSTELGKCRFTLQEIEEMQECLTY